MEIKMGKRSNFERNPRDYYRTPYEAVIPLLVHIQPKISYIEPCAGDGALFHHLARHGHQCYGKYDIEPQGSFIEQKDALNVNLCPAADYFVTNPPWDRKILHPMIEHFRVQGKGCWLLFDADWMHTKQAIPYLKYCEKIVSVGRVKWIPDSKMTGKDNCAWYKFVANQTKTEFVGR
jgi:hypothetical protein